MTTSKLQSILNSYKISATVVGESVGYCSNTYEVKLGIGAKVNSIVKLSNDIAMQLCAKDVRITPISENGICEIEVLHKPIGMVTTKDVTRSFEFKFAESNVTFSIGKDTNGNIVVGDLSKMPHLLVAGSTGSGKSVFLNNLIVSLLYKSSAEQVKMLMIDPKQVELTAYDGLPHLLAPVITDSKQAIKALEWAVKEMERRYEQFRYNGLHFNMTIKNLDSYNNIFKDYKMPHIIIIIDEFADLMMVSSKKLEEHITRLGQKARAAGIHLVLATQRPDRNVITGIIKSNIPSRIAFAVADAVNSRIILDKGGAEKLNGNGDMLYSPTGTIPIRVQGAFIGDDEIDKIVSYIKENSDEPEYDKNILNMMSGNNDIEDRIKAGYVAQRMFEEMGVKGAGVIGATIESHLLMSQALNNSFQKATKKT